MSFSVEGKRILRNFNMSFKHYSRKQNSRENFRIYSNINLNFYIILLRFDSHNDSEHQLPLIYYDFHYFFHLNLDSDRLYIILTPL